MSLPKEVFRLTYDVPALDEEGEPIEGERHECVRYYLTKKGLDRKLTVLRNKRGFEAWHNEGEARILKVDHAFIGEWDTGGPPLSLVATDSDPSLHPPDVEGK